MQSASDPFYLQRFVDARARVYAEVLDELLARYYDGDEDTLTLQRLT
jgi:uncharacterized protein (DUF1810 family)